MSKDIVIGIDLGTTLSVMSYLDAQSRPTTILNAEGDLMTPSVIFFDKEGALVGKEAQKAAEYDPDRVAFYPKREMGQTFYLLPVRGETLRPEVLQALILRKLKHDAQLRWGDVEKCIITVPAYFNEPRRKATQDAGRMAGWQVLDILNEPTAAAIAFGVQQGFLSGGQAKPELVLVYDLGGGTFDVTLMQIENGAFTTLATAGDVELGGIDWDVRIQKYLAEKFQAEHGVDLLQDPAALNRLQADAESAKKSLSSRSEVLVTLAHDGNRLRVTLTRSQFEAMTGELTDRTLMTIRKLLRESGKTYRDLTRVLAVGGSSRMPMVAELLERETGFKIDRSLSIDEAVSHGAAVYGAYLAQANDPAQSKFRIQNVNSHALGALAVDRATGMKRRQIMIPKNSALPARSRQRFVTYKDNQRSANVNIVEGGDDSGNGATQIGRCVLDNLPPNLPKNTPIEVTYAYSSSGRLDVKALIPSINREVVMTIERASGMPAELVESWTATIATGMPDGYMRPTNDPDPRRVSEDAPAETSEDAPAEPATNDGDDNPFSTFRM